MRDNPERLAWVVVLTSFFACIALTVTVPLGIRHYILHARVRQRVTLEVQQGPLRVTLAGRGSPTAINENRGDIPERTTVATDATAGRLVMNAPQADGPVLATVQLYDNTETALSSARSPRFSSSKLPHAVVLDVKAGRLRINVYDGDDRATIVEVQTPRGRATLEEGSYEVKVNGLNGEVTVRSGRAQVSNSTEPVVSLGPAERAIVERDQIIGPLDAARGLIDNGDFEAPLTTGWSSYSTQFDPQQPPGYIRVVSESGQKAVYFFRDGSNHAEVGIQQEINYDVRDFSFLQLHMNVRIISQNIAGFGGCGYLGTECPIIVRLDYKDVYGADREWLHGFYTGRPAGDWLINWWAEELQPDDWHTYKSNNLVEELADAPPAIIKSLRIYASGHNFHARVTDVELLVRE
jgi:hypothetical protein